MRIITISMMKRYLWIGVSMVVAAFFTANTVYRYQENQRMTEDHLVAQTMNEILVEYFDEVGFVNMNAPEIRSLINRSFIFDFVPNDLKSSFYFDLRNREVIVAKKYDLLVEGDFPSLEYGSQLEEIIKGFLLLDTDGSDLARTINLIRNLRDERSLEDSKQGLISTMERLGLGEHARRFTLDQAVYINDVYRLTNITSAIDETKIIFSDHLEVIHKDAFKGIEMYLPANLRLPLSVRLIEQNAFYSLRPFIQVTHDAPETLMIERNAFHPSDIANQSLYEREGLMVFRKLEIEIDYLIPTIRYYTDAEMTDYLGKTIENEGLTHLYNRNDLYVGSYIDNTYYDASLTQVTEGATYQNIVLLRALFYTSRYYTIEYEQNLTIRIIGDKQQQSDLISTFTTTFYLLDRKTIIEVKGFDSQGTYVARGIRVIEYRLIDSEDYVPSDPVFPVVP